jgi:hypothetical protein
LPPCRGANDNPARCPSNPTAFNFEATFPAERYIFIAVGKNTSADVVTFQLVISFP